MTFSEQISPCDTLACCWDINQASKQETLPWSQLYEKAKPYFTHFLQISRYIRMNFNMLPRPVGLLKLVQNVFDTTNLQRRDSFFRDFVKDIFFIGLSLDAHEPMFDPYEYHKCDHPPRNESQCARWPFACLYFLKVNSMLFTMRKTIFKSDD